MKDKRPEVIEKTTIPVPQISNLGVLVHWIPSAGLTHHQTLCLVLPPIITPLIGCSVQVVSPYTIYTQTTETDSAGEFVHTQRKGDNQLEGKNDWNWREEWEEAT